jgi:hypothetical protein
MRTTTQVSISELPFSQVGPVAKPIPETSKPKHRRDRHDASTGIRRRGVVEKAGGELGITERRVNGDLERFREFMEGGDGRRERGAARSSRTGFADAAEAAEAVSKLSE